MTGDAKAPVVVERVREDAGSRVLNTGHEKLHISLAAGAVTPELEQNLEFNVILAQAEAKLALALGSGTTTEMRGSIDEPEKPAAGSNTIISEALVHEALIHLIEGNFS